MFFLENDMIGLRNLTHTDVLGEYASWFNDEKVCAGNGHHKFPMSEENLKAYIDRVNDSRSDLVLAVIVKEANVHIGNISLQEIDYLNQQAMLAFMFGSKKYWGKGYATSAGILLIRHAFDELNLHRLYLGTMENNVAMQKLAEKLGFMRTGIRRKSIYKNGRFMDVYTYDLLKEEWNTKMPQ